jgi:hypothetical protein
MMKHIISYLLVFILTLPSFVFLSRDAYAKGSDEFKPEKDCKEGKCVDRLTGLLEAKTLEAQKNGCLPSDKIKDKTKWYKDHSISLKCFQKLKEIEELLAKIKKVEIYLSSLDEKGTCTSCKTTKSPVTDLMENIEDLDKANAQLTCSEEKKKQVGDKCGKDALCVLVASSLDVLGPIASNLIPASIAGKDCKNGQDSCLTQLATGFVKSVFGLFEGLWDLLKGAGKMIKKGITNTWNWVWGAEDKSSTSQLAAAKASENESVFQMLRKDFGGTISKIWSALVASIKDWLASNVFCQEWSGAPQFSQCLRPAQGFDCTSCKAMITGVCSISGTIIAEIIPAFLTGGLVTAAKFGVQGASKIAKGLKVSSTALKAIKSSKVSKYINPITKISRTVKTSKAVNVVADAIKVSLATIKRVLLKPIVKTAKASIDALKLAASSAKTFLMVTPAGPVISFSAKALKTTGKVVIYPFENAMTKKAYELGEKSVARLIKGTKPVAVNVIRPVVAGEASRGLEVIDNSFSQLKVAKLEGEASTIVEAEEKYLNAISDVRPKVLDDYLKNSQEYQLNEIIDELFPELNYGRFQKFTNEEILLAEESLLEAIQKLPTGNHKDKLAKQYQELVSSRLRKYVLFKQQAFSKDEVLQNAALTPEKKVERIAEILKNVTSAASERKILKVIEEIEKMGKGLFAYTADELAKQKKLLKSAGLKSQEADQVIKAGLVGRLQLEDQFNNLRKVIIPKSQGLIEEMAGKPDYKGLILEFTPDRKPAYVKAMKTMEEGGMSPSQVSHTMKTYQKNFNHVQKIAGSDTDAASMLAEFIRREKAAGLSDDLIKTKLEKAFGACK